MTTLTQLWKDQTSDFSTLQKAILGLIVSFIIFTAIAALIMVYFELSK